MNNYKSMKHQPPLSYFDKLFSDTPGDALFCSLNEVEKVFQDTTLPNDEFCLQVTIDPRTKLPITKSIYDYTTNPMPDKFICTNRSLLTKKEHSLCVDFLKCVQMKKKIPHESVTCFEATKSKRQAEKIAFNQFLLHYNNANFEKIYAPRLTCVELYQKYYKWQVKWLLDRYADGIFQIFAGFPIPRLCGNSDMTGKVTDVELMSANVPSYMNRKIDFSAIKPKLENFLEILTSTTRENANYMKFEEDVQFEISTEALVFLVSAGEYIDCPTEVVLTSVLKPDGECYIHIDDPLPSRNTGVHTCESVVKDCLEVFFEMKQGPIFEKINGTEFNGPYILRTHDEYVQTCGFRPKSHEVTGRTQFVKWNLFLENEDTKLSIYTQTKESYSFINKRECFSLKIEFKPQFGYEIPSKAFLLREWFEQRLLNDETLCTQRRHIDARTFASMCREELSLQDIEYQLEKHYRIKMSRLLGSLGDFLKLVLKISPGRYLLRYNPRFPDKLMLYSETKDVTSKTCVRLHGLLQEPVSDLAFMRMRQLVLIDDSLCSPSHLHYDILPCAFPSDKSSCSQKIIDDRPFILRKAKEKAEMHNAKKQEHEQNRKRLKRIRKQDRLKEKKKEKQKQNADVQALNDEINRDKILYGFTSSSTN